MENFISNPYVVGATIGITIVSAIISIVNYLRKKRQKLFVTNLRKWVYRSTTIDSCAARIAWNNISIDNVVLDRYLLVNHTSKVIDDHSFVKLPKIKLGEGVTILKHSVSNGDNLGSAELQAESSVITLSQIVLKPREGIVVNLVHDNPHPPVIEATMRDQPDLSYYQPYSEIYAPLIVLGLLLLISSVLGADWGLPTLLHRSALIGSLASFVLAVAFGKRWSMLPVERAFTGDHVSGTPSKL